MEQTRVLKCAKVPETRARRRISAAEWMGAERAEALLASAEAQAHAVRAAADQVRAAALQEGRAEGLAAAAGQVGAQLTRLAEAQVAWLARAEIEVVELGMEMARRILGRELQADPSAALAGAREALRVAGPARRLRVRLHPEVMAQLRVRLPELGYQVEGRDLELVADPALVPGDVLVETEAGQVDGRLERRLERFGAALARTAA
jgi:flagellar biosynthesis/type III secretory pathway protein FliH